MLYAAFSNSGKSRATGRTFDQWNEWMAMDNHARLAAASHALRKRDAPLGTKRKKADFRRASTGFGLY